jgi:hypothetical protein
VKKRGRGSYLEERLAAYIGRSGLTQPVREFRFAPPRLFRFDFAWPDRGLAVEIEGGVFIRGGHSRGVDFTDDCEKYNIAALRGWVVLRFTVKMFEDGSVYEVVREALTTEVRYVPATLTGFTK